MVATIQIAATKPILEIQERLEALEGYGIYTSLANLKKAKAGNFPYTLVTVDGRVDYCYLTGNYTNQDDDVNIVKLEDTPISQGALVRTTASSISTKPATASPSLNLDDAREHGVRMSRYGIRCDGSALDTSKWQDMIEEFAKFGIKRAIFNRGISGESVVDKPIINGNLSAGFQLIGEGRNDANDEFGQRLRIRYIGTSGAPFQIFAHNANNAKGSTTGDYLFEDLAVYCQYPGASGFDFNRFDTHGVVEDDSPYWYINQVKFRNIMLHGAGGGASQTGDGIKGAKMFGLEVDDHSFIREFRRGVGLYGCDEARLSPRGFLNGRQIHLEASGAAGNFGNSNIIACPFYGQSATANPEPTYQVWDNCDKTVIRPALWETDPDRNMVAHLYLGGRGTKVEKMEAASAPLFHLSPKAYNCEIDLFQNGFVETQKPIIDNPISWDDGERDYRLTITNANNNARAAIGTHPRILWGSNVSPVTGGLLPVRQDQAMFTNDKGYAPREITLTALTSGHYATLRKVNGARYIDDNECTSKWGILLPNDAQSLAYCDLVMGRDLVQANYMVKALTKRSDTKTYVASALKNGAAFQNLQIPFPTAALTLSKYRLDLTGWNDGDILRYIIQPVDGNSNGTLLIDYVQFLPMITYASAADDAAAAALSPPVIIGEQYFNTTVNAFTIRRT